MKLEWEVWQLSAYYFICEWIIICTNIVRSKLINELPEQYHTQHLYTENSAV